MIWMNSNPYIFESKNISANNHFLCLSAVDKLRTEFLSIVRMKHFVRISFWISFNIDSKFCLTSGRVHGQCNWPPEINLYWMFFADYLGTCPVGMTTLVNGSSSRQKRLDVRGRNGFNESDFTLEATDMNPWTTLITYTLRIFFVQFNFSLMIRY